MADVLLAMPVRTVFFIHIPKAAGTSVNAILSKSGYRQINMVDGYFASPPDEPHFFTGHYGLSHDIFRQYRDRPYVVFSALRDPIDRMISNYNFTLRRPDAPWHKETVSGKIDAVGLARNFIGAIGHQYSYFDQTRASTVEKNLHNLFNCIDEFGLSERLSELFDILSPALGTRITATATENVSEQVLTRDGLTQKQLQELTDLLKPDLWFYERASDEYARRRDEHVRERKRVPSFA